MGESIDGRADQYALGATAFHLLTGHPVFDYSNPAVVISRHLNAAPPRLSDRRSELRRPGQCRETCTRQGSRRPLRVLRETLRRSSARQPNEPKVWAMTPAVARERK